MWVHVLLCNTDVQRLLSPVSLLLLIETSTDVNKLSQLQSKLDKLQHDIHSYDIKLNQTLTILKVLIAGKCETVQKGRLLYTFPVFTLPVFQFHLIQPLFRNRIMGYMDFLFYAL